MREWSRTGRGTGENGGVISLVVLLLAASIGAADRAQEPDEHLLSFAVIGDWGSGLEFEDRIAARMCKYRESHPFDLVITTGDNIYPDGAPKYFEDNFFTPFDCLLSAGVRFRSSLGNHDVLTESGKPELEEPAFGMKRRNYVVRESGVRFVIANSNKIRKKWLRRKTIAEEGDVWTIVVFHHPVYSPGPHGPTPGFSDWMPRLFRKRGVDLVLNGHDHLYSVSKPLKGLRYVVTGGGGAWPYECGKAWFTAKCRSRHHFLYITATETELKVRAIPPKGKPFARFSTEGLP